MPMLVLDDVPLDIYNRLRQLAATNHEPVAAAAVHQLRRSFDQSISPAGPALPPLGSLPSAVAGISAHTKLGGKRLPDPPFLSEETGVPFDLPRPGNGACHSEPAASGFLIHTFSPTTKHPTAFDPPRGTHRENSATPCIPFDPIHLPRHCDGTRPSPANTLTPKEIADGWILLFDGKTTFGWKIEGMRRSKTAC